MLSQAMIAFRGRRGTDASDAEPGNKLNFISSRTTDKI